ncbi:MAG: ferrous iron transport protein [Thermosediminibacterales bacterium]|nr:ferrous iron transport protein [Thermosediminibacterales bacterium]MDK2835353.1 ferrous iron transport protein [Thermosediminibacterales bacterium]
MKVLLVGNPNVGKSAIFSQLTGVKVTTSNYPGTTVAFTRGFMTYQGRRVEIIDVPGTYHLEPENEAEKVAVDMIAKGDVLINVVDATNLERNLNLTLQLMEFGKPMVIALNLWDEAQHKGIEIDIEKLKEVLKIPVVATNGLTGEGLVQLSKECMKARAVYWPKLNSERRWAKIGEIVSQVQNLTHRRHTFMERIQDLSIHPILGLPLAAISLIVIFKFIISAGEILVSFMEKVFQLVYSPIILWLSDVLKANDLIHYLLIGEVTGGIIEYEEAMGMLTTGVFVAFGLVLPYIILFYLVLGFLEDLGYIPRVAIMFDRFLHNIGLHGYSIVPMLLACGCNVPGILAIRNLETRRERFITAIVTSITIPCMAQTALIIRAVGTRGEVYIGLVFTTLLTVWLLLGIILKKTVGGNTPTLLIEVPPYRLPSLKVQFKKLKMRLSLFLNEAIPYVLGGILFINFLNISGFIKILGDLSAPVIKGVFGLPEETVSTLIIGIVRKDAAVALLEPIGLNDYEMVRAVIILILYFPCVATFTVLLKELGIMDTVKAVGIMFLTTMIVGGLLNLLLGTVFNPAGMIIAEIITILFLIFLDSNTNKSLFEDEMV